MSDLLICVCSSPIIPVYMFWSAASMFTFQAQRRTEAPSQQVCLLPMSQININQVQLINSSSLTADDKHHQEYSALIGAPPSGGHRHSTVYRTSLMSAAQREAGRTEPADHLEPFPPELNTPNSNRRNRRRPTDRRTWSACCYMREDDAAGLMNADMESKSSVCKLTPV